MLTTWDYSPDKEALRLLHTACQIASGFYRLNNFQVLPYPKYPPQSGRFVAFPDLPYLSIPRFWEQAARINLRNYPSLAPDVPPQLLSATQKLLATTSLPSPLNPQLQSTWAKYESDLISAIYSLIPSQANSLSSIHIWPTVLGTSCSFNVKQSPSPFDLVIWLRQDQGITAIVEAILTSLTRNQVYTQLGGVWQESELLVDWLISASPLNSLIRLADPDWEKALTIKNTRTKQLGSLTEISEKFLRHIGAPHISPSQIDLDFFNPREREIMQLLLSNSPSPVTTDQIGDVLFKDNPDAYSLFAISKTIQRLRDKLEQNGISGSFIQTKRGGGYLLVS